MSSIIRKDSIGVKVHNRMLVISSIVKYGPISRTDLAKKMGMTKGGISPIINSLISEGALQEVGLGETTTGRKPKLLNLNGDYANAIVVNWGRAVYEAAFMNFKGEMKHHINGKIEKGSSLEEVLIKINNSIEIIADQNKDKKIIGIGVAAPGPIDLSTNTILEPPYFNGFSNIKVDEVIGEKLDLPVYLENDADARAIAEKYFGVGREHSDFVSITVLEGIGVGIVMNGVQYRNEDSFAGEFGHLTIDYKGKTCDCGNKGCLELYSSIRAIQDKISEVENRRIEWPQITEKIADKDNRYLEIVNDSMMALGSGIVSLIHMFQPKSIAIGGDIIELGESIIIDNIKDVVDTQSIFKNYYSPDIQLSKVDNACLKGIAMSVYEKILK